MKTFYSTMLFSLVSCFFFSNCLTPKAAIKDSSVFTKAEQKDLTPNQALQLLKDGNKRFVDDKLIVYHYPEHVKESAKAQAPFAAILSCMDSRTGSETVFNLGLGDVFNIRIAGNIADAPILGSLEYACAVAGSKLILVEGHTHCGAIHSAIDKASGGNITALLKPIKHAVEAVPTKAGESRTSSNEHFFEAVIEENVWETIAHIRSHSETLAKLEREGKIKIVGSLYDIQTGVITFYEGRDLDKLHSAVHH